jgi:hypothetical protein
MAILGAPDVADEDIRRATATSVNVASTYLGFRWIDRLGRRKLAIGGAPG